MPVVTVCATYSEIASTPSKAAGKSPQLHKPRSQAQSSKDPVSVQPCKMESSGGTVETVNSKPQTESTRETTPEKTVRDTDKSRGSGGLKDSNSTAGTASPSQSSNSISHGIPSHGTPQQGGYYVAYNNLSQMTPKPTSPHTGGATAIYDVSRSFFQQPTGFHSSPFTAIHTHPYGVAGPGQPQPPGSPNSQIIPPASPLFPRITNAAALLSAARSDINPALSPGPPYVSSGGSTEDFAAWGDSR